MIISRYWQFRIEIRAFRIASSRSNSGSSNNPQYHAQVAAQKRITSASVLSGDSRHKIEHARGARTSTSSSAWQRNRFPAFPVTRKTDVTFASYMNDHDERLHNYRMYKCTLMSTTRSLTSDCIIDNESTTLIVLQ